MPAQKTCAKCGRPAQHSVLVDEQMGTRSVVHLCTLHAGQEGLPVEGDDMAAAAAAIAEVSVGTVRLVCQVIRSMIAAERRRNRDLSVESAVLGITPAAVSAGWQRWTAHAIPHALDRVLAALKSVGLLPPSPP